MDWDFAIERNREALKGVLTALVAMAGLAVSSLPSPLPARRGGAGTAEARAHPALPRHLHRAVLRLLRPAEAAARRLVIVAARGLVVTLPRPRLREPKPKLSRLSPLRLSRPPGLPRRPVHAVHDILKDTHGLAFEVLESLDTS